MEFDAIHEILENKYAQFCRSEFIADDPISIPHRFTLKQDIEISGLFAAILAWGQRKTIINKCTELMDLMDNAPFDFITSHQDSDLKAFTSFKHRTFNTTDTLYFLSFLKHHYTQNQSLETLFSESISPNDETVEKGLINFRRSFFSLDFAPDRTKKHIATPERNSACKRLNMYLRWMVRPNTEGVDFGIWKNIKTSQLLCPLDVHVDRVGRKLGLINRKQCDWKTASELTSNLKLYCKEDPVKYDFALFGMGVMEEKI